MGFKPGDTVGDYQIISLLGAGGMGKVYKVKNTISDRVDALKVLLPDLAEDPELADRFIREIKVLASLEHPNIAGLRTAFRLENQLLMVMEYVEGTTLDERAKAGPIPVPDAINYITQALSALGFAHKHGVIHRDIKPANMMLTPDNVIKLMDFGIAKAKSDKKLTQTGTTMGSLFYMSAEQVQGGELDGRSDLYSIGVSLYELVTGVRPFQGKSDFDIMVAQLQQTPQAPIQMMPHLPKALNDIIMISLEKDPAKRFQTAEAFIAALGSLGQMLQATPMQGSGTQAFGSIPPVYSGAPAATGSATGMMATQTTPAPPAPAPAAGGTIPPSQPYISTNSMPTVMAPQPPTPTTAPAPPAIAPPGPYQAPPPPTGSKGYRGLYMTLGALIVLAILAVAAIEGTRFLKARAGGDQTAQVTNTTANPSSISVAPSTPSADSNTQPVAGAAGSSAASGSANSETAQAGGAFTADNSSSPPAAQGSSGSTSSAGSPSSQNPATPNGSATPTAKKTAKNQSSPLNQAAGGGQNSSSAPAPSGAIPNASPSGAAGAGQATPQASANDAAKKQELEELADLHDKLSVRAVSVDEHVETLRKQMSAGGNNLRSDISSSQTRMKMYMDKFDAAMSAGDPVAAKKYMHQAEHEVETLEKFFGQ
jgi:serine/threonine-protein kinase